MTKLMKLLNFFDFEHFKKTGYPSIALEYYAFRNGPVPKKFWLEVKDGIPPDDLSGKVMLRSGERNRKETEFIARPGAQVDFTIFTRREQEILQKLAYIYQDVTAETMSDISHEAEKPWAITITEKGLNAPIDYLLALDEKSEVDREEAEENLRDLFLILKAFDIEPAK